MRDKDQDLIFCLFLPLLKPTLDPKDSEIDFDSGEESEDNHDDDDDDNLDDDDPFSNAPPKQENREASNPNSYAWCLMRYGSIRMAQIVLETFIAMVGIELPGKSHSPTSNGDTLKVHISRLWPRTCPLTLASTAL